MKYIYMTLVLLFLFGCASMPLDQNSAEMQMVIKQVENGDFDQALISIKAIPSSEKGFIFYEIKSKNHRSNKLTTFFPKEILIQYLEQLKAWRKQVDEYCESTVIMSDADAKEYQLRRCYGGFRDDPYNQTFKFSGDYNKNLKFNRVSHEKEYDDLQCDRKNHYMAYCSPLGLPAEDLFSKALVSKIELLNEDIEKIEKLAKDKEDEREMQRAQLEASPDYRKCAALQSKLESEKMIKIWNKNIEVSRQRSKEIGKVTDKIASEIERSLAMIDGFKLRLKNANQALSSLSKVEVSNSKCTQLIDGFGKSSADRYLED